MGGQVASQPIGIRKTIGKPSINGISTSVYPEWLIDLDSSFSSLPKRQFEKRSSPKRGKHRKHCPAELLVVKWCKGHEDCQFCRAWQGQTPTPWHHWWADLSGDVFFSGGLHLANLGYNSKVSPKYHWLVVRNMFYFPFHIWDVIPTPLTNSYFSEGWLTHQPVQVE